MGACLSGNKAGYNIRVLVLGISNCGKSTFARQMKILHCNGFNNDEVNNYREVLIQNLMLGFREIIASMDDNIPKNLKKAVKFFNEANAYGTPLSDDLISKAQKIWEDETVQEVLESSRNLEYRSSLKYMMDNIDRVHDDNWRPTNDDILHARQRTTGIIETKFTRDKYEWSLIDVGGQKVERKKWLHTQQNLNAVIYFAALDEYDVMSEEDSKITKLEESMLVWEETLKGEALKGVPVILFLNKVDIFKEKIKSVPLKKTYKKYKGGDDLDSATEFIKDLYGVKITSESVIGPMDLFWHVICALDTEGIRLVFDAVKDFIFRKRLEISGL